MVDGVKYATIGSAMWFTNLDITKRHEPLDMIEKYSPEKYPKYDNYDAINVNRIYDIPYDNEGVMGVPITFMDKYCPEQFEIIGLEKGSRFQYWETLPFEPFDFICSYP